MNSIERAIKHFTALQKRYTTQHNGTQCELVAMALSALAEEAARIDPKPLTLDELYLVDNEPLYFFCTVGKWSVNGWHIVEPINYENASFKDLRLDHNDNTIISTFNYGNNYVAYRHPPKEEQP